MYRDVQINIPMFIGIILLVAVVTAVLVYGVNVFTDLMHKNNEKINAEVDDLDKWFNAEINNNEVMSKDWLNEVLDEATN